MRDFRILFSISILLMLSQTNQYNTRSIPIEIPIPKKSINREDFLDNNVGFDETDYKLDFNFNDPSKFSPPNNWTGRLKTRIKQSTFDDTKCRVINSFVVSVPISKN